MPTPLKLGYLVPQFPGQTHIFFWREIAALEAMGVEVQLFSTRPPPRGLIAHDWSDAAMARTTYLGVPGPLDAVLGLAQLGRLTSAGERAGIGRDLALAAPAARRLKRAAARRGISHVHVHSCGRAALIAALARRMGGPGYSLTLHGPLSDYGPGQRLKWQGAAFGTVITEKLRGELRAELGDVLPGRLPIRPMGVDTEVLKRPTPYLPAAPGEALRLFSCARLNVVKGHQDLMQAVRMLLDQGLDLRLDIAGEDDDGGAGFHGELQAQLEALNLQEHVRLLGAIDAGAVRARLLEAHIFVLASWHEPLGVAYMEAMSCEVPTIGTDAGGVPELIRDGVDALLVPPRAPEALAAAIRALAEDPARAQALSAAGRARIVSGFRSVLGAETLVEEIGRLQGESPPSRA